MQNTNEAIKKLARYELRYKKFKEIFNAFQEDMSRLANEKSPLKEIKVAHESDTVSRIQLFDLDLKIAFSLALKDGAPKGKLSFLKMNPYDDKDITEVNHMLFNGEGVVHIDPPEGEDQINILYGNGLIIILNWLCDELEEKSKESDIVD